jgi:hypothetical protein
MKKIVFIVLAMLLPVMLFSQDLIQPNYALKSHETLEIRKIALTSEKTVISMSIENRVPGGQFCADRNIYVVYPDNTRILLSSSSGIPECPDAYKFRNPGEKLDFILNFPPLKAGVDWIDIIEDCSDNCFSFYGVVLNRDINDKINEAVLLTEKGVDMKAIDRYKGLIKEVEGKGNGIEGALYSDLIILLERSGKRAEAADLYRKLKSSGIRNRGKFILNLNSQGIKF